MEGPTGSRELAVEDWGEGCHVLVGRLEKPKSDLVAGSTFNIMAEE